MDPVSKLSQTKLNDGKLNIQVRKRFNPMVVVGFLVVVLVIAAVLGGGYLLIRRANNGGQAAADAPVDSSPLTVTVWKPIRSIVNPSTEVTVVANKQITLEQSTRASLHDIGQLNSQYYYVAQVVNLPVAETDITLKFNDAAGNHFEQPVKITRTSFGFPPGYTQLLPWANSQYVLNADDLSVTVDKAHRLLEDYEPSDLVDLNKTYGLYTLNNAVLRRDAGAALKAMLDQLAKETGKYVTVASGYRSYEQQVATYAINVRQLGEDQANNVSSKPGNSQHQLGTTVDFVSDETTWKITKDFGNTVAGQWLATNCAHYGFVQPYKQENSNTSGYVEEAWHFRYVGVQPTQ